MKAPNIGNLVEWIKANRKGNAFKDYDDIKITTLIFDSLYHNCLAYSLNDEGGFTGVVCGTKNANKMIVTIHDILTTKRGITKKFMEEFNKIYPGWQIDGICRGRVRKFQNTTKLERRLK